jgi:hypothetical protein
LQLTSQHGERAIVGAQHQHCDVGRGVRSASGDESQRAVQKSTPCLTQFAEEIDSVLHRKAYRAYDAETGREVEWNVVALTPLPAGAVISHLETRKALISRLRLLGRLVHPGLMQCIHFWVNPHRRELVYTNEIVIRSTLKQ